MALPPEFWIPNEFGVRGGVEPAYMSMTTSRDVAMGYASGDAERMGIVVEVRQGMINRGADMSWLSQYPHERECAAALHLISIAPRAGSVPMLHWARAGSLLDR